MPKFPVDIDGKTVQVQEFVDKAERIVIIGERTYRIWHLDDDNECYAMVKIRGTKRSLKGKLFDVRQALVRVHEVYRKYDDQARKAKENAQKARDAALHKIVESVVQP